MVVEHLFLPIGPFGNYMYLVFIWKAFEDKLFQLIVHVYAWKMTCKPHMPGGIPICLEHI